MLRINPTITIAEGEIEISAVRAQGAGGQNVNKVSTAIHLRFDISASSLPDDLKQRLLTSPDGRLSKDGVLIIKAQRFRSQEKNRADAMERLVGFIKTGLFKSRLRKPTRPTRVSVKKRVDFKVKRGRQKKLRSKIDQQDY